MVEILLPLIEQLSSVFVLIAILILAFILAFKAGKWAETLAGNKEKVVKTEEGVRGD